MISINKSIAIIFTMAITSWIPISQALTPKHEHHATAVKKEKLTTSNKCKNSEIECVKTVTSAFAPNGDLWRLWAHQQKLWVQVSQDNGATFLPQKMLAIPAEKISARNENRPKIAFDNTSGVYLSWATPREKKYTADVRFSYSKDYGKTFIS